MTLPRLLLLPLTILLGLAFARFPLPASLALCGCATIAHGVLAWRARGTRLKALEDGVRFAVFCTAPTALSLVYAINDGLPGLGLLAELLPGAGLRHGVAALLAPGGWLHLALSWCLPAFFMGCGLARRWLAQSAGKARAGRALGVGGGGMLSWSLCYTVASFGMWFAG
ncbi:hypothetical protein [Marinimicrococcus flavescens]|uniref:Uncharacterized protein n=1 Tax=Marinimicrococcus flavescens TaxID=3031815 RepID=A0AAP3XSL7_9PROT|nr:hypothetical protein [Marinimicrococcus flavescens]